jgi:WD40 repeat protein
MKTKTFTFSSFSVLESNFHIAVKLWDGYNGAFLATFRGHVGPVYQVAWAADGRLLVSGSKDSTLKVWDITSKKLIGDLPGHADEVFRWGFSCFQVITNYSRSKQKEDCEVAQGRNSLYVCPTNKITHSGSVRGACSWFLQHPHAPCSVDWSPDGVSVASGGKDRVLKLWRN